MRLILGTNLSNTAPPQGGGQSVATSLRRALQAQLELALPNNVPQIDVLELGSDTNSAQIGEWAQSCHIAPIDLSNQANMTSFALGHLVALNVPYIALAPMPALSDLRKSLRNILEFDIIGYENLDRLPMNALRRLVAAILIVVREPSTPVHLLRSVWFRSRPSELHVINPPEFDKSQFASPNAPNYIYIDNLGDRDALVDVLAFINRYYPSAENFRYSSEDFPKQYLGRNLITIGGPGVVGVEPGNGICRLLSQKAGSSVTYRADGELAYFDHREWATEYDEDGRITRDFGYFARFSNPLNAGSTVVMIHGSHTSGVLGAVKAFSDHPNAQANIESVLNQLGTEASFEAGFEVDIVDGAVSCPKVQSIRRVPG